MKQLGAFGLASLLAFTALGQSVPSAPIVQGQVWTVAQWNSAWQSKADTASPVLTGIPTLNGIAIPTVLSPAFLGTPTIAGVPIPTYPTTAAEIAASVTPVQLTVAPCNVNRYAVNATPGTTDMSTAMANALLACTSVYVPAGTYVVQAVVPNTSGLVIHGDGPSSVLKQKGTGAVLSWNTAAVVYPTVLQTIRDLAFDGTNGGTHTINTSGAGGPTLENLYFSQIPTGFDSIFVNGTAATLVHDVRLIDIRIYVTQAGNAGVEFGPLVNDSNLSQLIMQGSGVVANCIEFDNGASAITVADSHPYNCSSHILYLVGNNSFNQFTHVAFDNTLGTGDLVLISSGSYNQFTDDYFENVSGGKNGVTLTNSLGNGFVNDLWFGQAGSGYAVQETGTSNNNFILSSTVNSNAVWTAGVFGLISASSSACNVPGVANINCPVRSGTTGSIGGGALGAGACASGTATVTGATSSMSFAVTPSANPQVDASHGVSIWSYLSAANTVTVNVCAIVATTPNAATYNVRALQ